MLIKKTFIVFLLLTLPGCFLFRKSIDAPFEIVRIPGGVFQMGDVFEHRNQDATPVHEVRVAPFEIGTYEVTYAQYDAFAAATGRSLPDDDGYGRGTRAVVNISWHDALAFCLYYNFRLPTEEEWEYAARSGGQNQIFAGADSLDAVDRYVRHIDNSVLHAFQVGTKAPNGLGLYDMSGNVYEWIGDYYEFYPETGSDPIFKNLEESSMRIIRGGSFKHDAMYAKTYWRSGTLADIPSNAVGFRCARGR